MKYREADIVQIQTTYNLLRNSILTALERDTGRFDIVDEILRILSIHTNRRNKARTRAENFGRTLTQEKHLVRVTGQKNKGVVDVF